MFVKWMVFFTLCLVLPVASVLAAGPLRKTLPTVSGHSLAGDEVTLPKDLQGAPAVLLVAYRRGTQPDVDRWMEFLKAKAGGTTFLEVPTISNPVWRPLAGWIDGGMRNGVPRPNWSRVVTLYDDAPKLKDFLGDFGGLNTHVVLLDGDGAVVWFYAGGYSEGAARDLLSSLTSLDAMRGGSGGRP